MTSDELSLGARAELVAAALNQVRPGWTADGSGSVRGPGSLAVTVASNHTDEPRHLDLSFILNVERPDETSIIDCVTGMAPEPATAIGQAIRMWMSTTAAAVFELLDQRGEQADQFGPGDPKGFPGWHMIGGTVIGWGVGDDVSAIRDWFAATTPWQTLAPVIETGLDRAMLNGIKFYLAAADGFESAEVRINGTEHEPSSSALANLGWPRTKTLTSARTYTLLVHRDSDQSG